MRAFEVEFFDTVGSFGSWQVVLFALLFFINIMGIWQSYAMTFLAPNVPFRCSEPSVANATSADVEWPEQCSVYSPNVSAEVPCTRWEYDTSEYSDTLVNEFDLVCGREWLVSFAKSVYMIGFMASMFVFGQLSDRIGRRPTIFICFAINCVGSILSLFSTSIELFLLFRFLQAFGRTGITTVGFVLLMESVGLRHRTSVSLAIQLGWSMGLLLLALIGYVLRDWFWYQMAIAAPSLLVAPFLIFVPESPRWLLMHGRKEEMKKLMVTATNRNKMDLEESVDDILKRLFSSDVSTYEKKGTLLDLFRTPRMRGRILVSMYLWLVNAVMYYALSYNTNDFSGNPYINFLLVGVLEFPSYGLLYLTLKFFGRRTVTASCMVLCGATSLALAVVPPNISWLSSGLPQAGKFFVTASFGLLYLYTAEMFPTMVRSAAIGSCSTVARIGSIVAPFSRELGKATDPVVPNILLSVLAVSSGFFTLWLPETTGRKLPDTLEEGEKEFMMKDTGSLHKKHLG